MARRISMSTCSRVFGLQSGNARLVLDSRGPARVYHW